MIVDVHLDQAHGTVGIAHRFFDDRAELAARAAPWCPEVDQDGNLARRFATKQQERVLEASLDQATLEGLAVDRYVDLYVV